MNAEQMAKRICELIEPDLCVHQPSLRSAGGSYGPHPTVDFDARFVVQDPDTGVRYMVKVFEEPTAKAFRG